MCNIYPYVRLAMHDVIDKKWIVSRSIWDYEIIYIADVTMAGCVGNDIYGEQFIRFFTDENFDVSYIKKSALSSTGYSLVTVETCGQNRICLVSGANMDYTAQDVFGLEKLLASNDVIVTQGEMRFEVVRALAGLCVKYGKKFIFNPAPARELPDEVLQAVYVLTPNETELGIIVGRKLTSRDDFVSAAKQLVARGVKNVVVTLGASGSLLVNDKETLYVSAYKVNAVDTVGAGDSFTGSLAALVDAGERLFEAVRKSAAVGALAVQKEGAIPSMPYLKDVEKFLADNRQN